MATMVTLEGVLRGQGQEATCTVLADEVSLPGSGLPPERTGYRIRNVSKSLPEGEYRLEVDGERLQVRQIGGHWVAA